MPENATQVRMGRDQMSNMGQYAPFSMVVLNFGLQDPLLERPFVCV